MTKKAALLSETTAWSRNVHPGIWRHGILAPKGVLPDGSLSWLRTDVLDQRHLTDPFIRFKRCRRVGYSGLAS